ncbi:hypothetical protein THII_3047 [Thioploca ingrica]|uniref:Uncharacterized protein n=1 Tax=Thioploca ingrica TaxID=40754 RepID=A0A090AIX7_9GAMM|nr:hypothetical protein THII_3047 [Thioploca ingrica]
MKFSDEDVELLAELFEEQQYQDELMLGLQTIDSHMLVPSNQDWHPDFAEIYNQLIELEDGLPYIPYISLVKH